MDSAVKDRLALLKPVLGVFALSNHDGTRLIGITKNAKKDIEKLMWAESCGSFWFKPVGDMFDAKAELAKLHKRMPGVRVWPGHVRVKPALDAVDWSGKGIHGLDKLGPIDWIK